MAISQPSASLATRENKEHKNTVDSFDYQELEEPPIKRRTAWYKKYLPHYHSLLQIVSFPNMKICTV